MADLEMPQRQTYPYIKGRIQDEVGPLPLDQADEIELHLEVDALSTLYILTATSIDPEDPSSIFLLNGDEIHANFQAPVGNSGVSEDVQTLRGKLKITWDATSTPPAVQYAPKVGFLEVVITENVQAEA